MLDICPSSEVQSTARNPVQPVGATVLLNFQKLARSVWERPCVAMGCKAAPDALSSRPSIILHNRLWRVLSQPGQWLILRRAGHWHRRQQGRPRLAVISLGRRTRGNLRVWRRRRRTGRAGYWRREPGWRTGSFCQGQASHQQRGEDRVKHQQPPVGNLSTGYA